MNKMPFFTEIPYCDAWEVYGLLANDSFALFLDSANHKLATDKTQRYSYIVANPVSALRVKNYLDLDTNETLTNPFTVIQQKLQAFKLATIQDLPPFQGGAVGLFSYDVCQYLEKLPAQKQDDGQFPDIALGFFDVVISFDHQQQRTFVVASGYPEQTESTRLSRAKTQCENYIKRILTSKIAPLAPPKIRTSIGSPRSPFNSQSYQTMVKQAQDYILNGDIFEVNVSQRMQAQLPVNVSPQWLYHILRTQNPAPFGAFLNFGDFIIASMSPERFIALNDGHVETRPIKGTIRRDSDPQIDNQNASWLQASTKDRAENIMIVDLLRNDLSRVCQDNSILVSQLCGLESFSTVHHLVSVIQGQLKPGCDAIDLLKATLPGGSVTGAPKIRAMEIINELEPTTRGPYCGCIGFIGFNGGMDTSIVIRTFAIKNGIVTFQVGGAVVLDSDPAQEYQETLDKAKPLLHALRHLYDFTD